MFAGRQGMHRTQLLCLLAVSLCLAGVARSQTLPSPSLTAAQRAHLKEERFQAVTSVRGLPLGVREALQALFGTGSLDIAEPGAEFQATDVVVNPKLPRRRLVAAGCSSDHCVVHYERGGIVATRYVTLFHWTPAATRFEWGGTAPRTLATIADVRSAILAGEVKSPATTW
jgi:hypothetical protein